MKLIIALAVSAGVIFLVNYLSDALLPFFVACFIAYMLQPLVGLNRRLFHLKGRIVASLLAVVEITAVVGGVTYLFLPHVVSEVEQMEAIIRGIADGKRPVPVEYASLVRWAEENFHSYELKAFIGEFHLQGLIAKGTSLLEESVGVIIRTLEWALTIIYVIFILIDYPQIARGFKLIVPYRYRPRAVSVMKEVQTNMNHYFRGQGFLALCAAVGYCIGFSIVGLPLAVPMGLLVGLLYMIPYFQYITIIPVAAICLLNSLGGGEGFALMFGKSLLVYLCVQPCCDYIITPHVMGKEMGLNPAMILLALSVWGSLMGIIGMIIALPATSLLFTYYQRYISSPRQK